MKLKLDENLSPFLKRALENLDHDVKTVLDEKLDGHPDAEVLDAALKEARLLFTADHHLGDVKRFPPGTHAGVVLFKPRRPRRTDVIEFILDFVGKVSLEDLAGLTVVVKPEGHKVIKQASEK